MFKNFGSTVFICSVVNVSAYADSIEEVTIIGNRENAQTLPGSAHVIDEQALLKFEYTDINRMMRQVPGVYLQEEDGFGLRPNIGIRGAGAERSEKITLLEDGVLIAPAPYSAPAAYYFPTAGRMSGIEVLKGSSLLKYGPSTVAGVVNLVSAPIPEDSSGVFNVESGENSSNKAHIRYGNRVENMGFLLETYQAQSDGFKRIDRSPENSGFDIEDYMLKFSVNGGDKNQENYQQLDVKLQYSEESSDVTYVGLSDADFDRDMNRRYGLTALDQMSSRHVGFSARHLFKVNPNLKFTTTAYRNSFARDWFKVDKINGNGFGRVIDAANDGEANAQGILDGTVDAEISIKHNDREYVSEGVQSIVDWRWREHAIQGGVRYHEDSSDRFQPSDIYFQRESALIFDRVSQPSASNNRLEEAKATSAHLMDVWQVKNDLALTLGVRYENIRMQQRRYSDTARSESTLSATNQIEEIMTGVGVTYELNNQWQLLAGAHTGFAPASPSDQNNIEPEKSTNYEMGLRFSNASFDASALTFYSDYSNKVTNCSVAFPCGELTTGSVSEGEASIAGIELSLSQNLAVTEGLTVPLSVVYTYTLAEISDPAQSTSQKGEALPYTPKNVLNIQTGLESSFGWNTYLSMSYVDKMCIYNRCGNDSLFSETEETVVVDLTSHYAFSEGLSMYIKWDNLLDQRQIVARSPGGARPNKPRTLTVGFKLDF